MNRFYDPDFAATGVLNEDESRHCVRVLRMAAGDEVEVVDGRGTLYRCRITLAHPKHCALAIEEERSERPHWGHRITLAVAPTKHLDRMEWMVEKCTEVGVDRIVPLLCRNSERTVLKTPRLRAIMVAAMKQSLKTTLPQLDEMTPLTSLLGEAAAGDRFIAYCDPALPREQRRELAQVLHGHRDVTILIGPEGDFAPDEVAQATAAGFVPVTLGQSRLRTCTAALAALVAVHTVDALDRPENDNPAPQP